MSAQHSRLIFNFGDRCNMRCPYCYVPFRSQHTDLALCQRIVTRAAECGFQTITLGGGDPLRYEFLGELVAHATASALVVHIDTNGLSAKRSDLADMLKHHVALLGLPLDGPDDAVHGRMRNDSAGHFSKVVALARWAAELGTNIKVNTVIGKPNLGHERELARLVVSVGAQRWSLYRYWPLSFGATVSDSYSTTDADFQTSTARAVGSAKGLVVETVDWQDRQLTYPFVSQDGTLYIHSAKHPTLYETVGSIFDDDAISVALLACRGDRSDATTRYLSRT